MQAPPAVVHLSEVWEHLESWLQPGSAPCSHWSAPRCVWNEWHSEAMHHFVLRTASRFDWINKAWQVSFKEEVEDRRWQLMSNAFQAEYRSDPNWSDLYTEGCYGGYESGASS